MMQIISHRGYWLDENEKNTLPAFARSFQAGFGVETDVRDFRGELVISHDIATDSFGANHVSFSDFMALYEKSGNNVPLALNIKADGLQDLLGGYLQRHLVHNYFVFDMSVPEMVGYMNKGFRFCTRQSEYETMPVLSGKACGIWLDSFEQEGFSAENLKNCILSGPEKLVCIVSPELHQKPHLAAWESIKEICFGKERAGTGTLMLCTDIPEEARRFFNGL
jgi:hypothetical protein